VQLFSRIGIRSNVSLKEVFMDLTTKYMGLELKTPLIVSACPLSAKFENFKRMQDAGAGAVVMFSLFEEQVSQAGLKFELPVENKSSCFTEAQTHFPAFDHFSVGPEAYLDLLHKASNYLDIPVIASINGVNPEAWLDYAKRMEQAGAAGLELNIFHMPTLDIDGSEQERHYLEAVKTVKSQLSIPVALKMNPFFSSLGSSAKKLDDIGVDALVLFNRFFRPDFDIDLMTVRTDMGLSQAQDIRLPLQWISILHGKLSCSLAATRGVQTHEDLVKYILAGADTVMVASSLLKNGIEYLEPLRDGLIEWMDKRDFKSIDEIRGLMSQSQLGDPRAFERMAYVKNLESFRKRYW